MANKKIMIGVGVAAVAIIALVANVKKSIKSLEYTISDLKLDFSSILSPKIKFTIVVFNPNPVAIIVNSFYGQIKRNGTILASFSNNSPLNFETVSHKNVNINANLKTIALLSQLISLLGNNASAPVTVEGMMVTPSFSIPINQELSLSKLTSLAGLGEIFGDGTVRRYHHGGKRKKISNGGKVWYGRRKPGFKNRHNPFQNSYSKAAATSLN